MGRQCIHQLLGSIRDNKNPNFLYRRYWFGTHNKRTLSVLLLIYQCMLYAVHNENCETNPTINHGSKPSAILERPG